MPAAIFRNKYTLFPVSNHIDRLRRQILRIHCVRAVAATLFFLVAGGCTTLQTPTFADDAGAIRGYDPVAYHLVQAPTKGNAGFSSKYNGATWYFATAANKSLFDGAPQKYAPQYGGYCSYAMSKGFVVSIDPDAWTIVDDKLYLNYSLGVRNTWLKDVPGYVEKANNNWQQKIAQPEFK